MSSKNAPYFINADDFSKFPGPDNIQAMYPDITQAATTDTQMYALADGAMQVHQGRNHIDNLVQAAGVVTNEDGHNDSLVDESEDRHRATRKRKRQASEGEADGNGQQDPVAALSSSASALFRKPSANSKKYTRPPMSKLYTSLELSPESFLQLQSAAKNYMLNPAFPERQDTVGQRGKGDSELVKLRLWNCVKDFLENEGNGPHYFGEGKLGEDDAPRTMIWPRDKNAIIGAVTPLLRRMVTNERQRQYAVESRKGGEPDSKKQKTDVGASEAALAFPLNFSPTSHALFLEITDTHIESYPPAAQYAEQAQADHHDPTLAAQIETLRVHSGALRPEIPGIMASIDHHLRNHHKFGLADATDCTSTCEDELITRIASSQLLQIGEGLDQLSSAIMQPKEENIPQILHSAVRLARDMVLRTPSLHPLLPTLIPSYNEPTTASTISNHVASNSRTLRLHISHLSSTSTRLAPRRDVAAEHAPYLHTVVQEALASAGPSEKLDEGLKHRVRVLTERGLVEVGNDEEWREVLEECRGTEWLDGEAKVLVDRA